MTQERDPSIVRQEPPGVAGGAVVLAGAIVILVSIVSVIAMVLILRGQSDRLAHSATAVPAGPTPRAPLIERTVLRESARGQELQAKARRELDQWGWVENGKVARIPITAAIRTLAHDARQQRLVWPDREATPDAGSGAVTP